MKRLQVAALAVVLSTNASGAPVPDPIGEAMAALEGDYPTVGEPDKAATRCIWNSVDADTTEADAAVVVAICAIRYGLRNGDRILAEEFPEFAAHSLHDANKVAPKSPQLDNTEED